MARSKAEKFSTSAEASRKPGCQLKRERDRRRVIARLVAKGALCIPVIVVGEDDDARRDVLRQVVCNLMRDGSTTCMLQLDNCTESEALTELAIASHETVLEDDAPRVVVCDGLPLDDETYARGIAALVEHSTARGTKIVLGVTPDQIGITDAIGRSISYEVDTPTSSGVRMPLPTFLYVSEAAEIARCSDNYIYGLVRDGAFTDVTRCGRRLLLRTSSFLRFLGLDEGDLR
jgi:hypothetical protein